MVKRPSRRSHELPFRFSDYVRDVGWVEVRHGGPAADDGRSPAVLMVDWSHLIEDSLDELGLSIEAFRTEMTDGWMFGYVEALKHAGVRTVLACVSARVTVPRRVTHEPTGATLCLLPAPNSYRAVRRRVPNPYAGTLEQAVGAVRGPARLWYAALRELAPWLATPVDAIAAEVEREGCRAIICQDYEHPRFDLCVRLGRRLGVPVFGIFEGGGAVPRGRVEQRLRPWSVRGAAGLIIGSAREAERVRARYGVGGAAVARVGSPLDLDAWRPAADAERAAARDALGIPAAARVAAWHGRVEVRAKGLDLLVDAWHRLTEARDAAAPPARLLLIGTGGDAPALSSLVAGLGPEGGVVWVDRHLPDRALLRRNLVAADVYVLPSRREGLPVNLAEAMACGLPVVAADVGGIADLLEGGAQGTAGVIVPPDDAGALAAALGRVLDDPLLGVELGRRARARAVATFPMDAVGALIRDFMTSRGARLGPAGH